MQRVAGVVLVLFCLVGLALGVVALVVPSEADAQTARPGSVQRTTLSTTCASTTCSGTAPSGATAGAPIAQATAVLVRVCADESATLSGAGSLQAYFRDETDGLWSRAPGLDKALSAADSGERCATFPGTEVHVSYGRLSWVPSGVTLSTGDLTVTLYAATLRR